MWYAVFDRCMVSGMLASLGLLGYLAIKNQDNTLDTGPFYFAVPLPILLLIFWRYTNRWFSNLSQFLSLEDCIALDGNSFEPTTKFDPNLYRQVALVEGPLVPEAYRVDDSINSSQHAKQEEEIVEIQPEMVSATDFLALRDDVGEDFAEDDFVVQEFLASENNKGTTERTSFIS